MSGTIRKLARHVPFLRPAYIRIVRLKAQLVDRWLNIETLSSPVPELFDMGHYADGNDYEGTPYALLRRSPRFLDPIDCSAAPDRPSPA